MRGARSYVAMFATVALLVLVITASHVWAARRFGRRVPVNVGVAQQAAPSTPAAQVPPKEKSALDIPPAQAYGQLLSLHRLENGGTDKEFAEALRKVIAEEAVKNGADPETILPSAPPAILANERISEPVVAPREVPATAPAVESLRTSYEHFERRALELEAQKDYSAADSARTTAAALRAELRRLDP